MQQALLDACNSAQLLLVCGSNIAVALRDMLKSIKGDFSLIQLSDCNSHTVSLDNNSKHLSPYECNHVILPNDVRVVLVPLDTYDRIKDEIQPSIRNRYWVWTEQDVNDSPLSDFNAVITVKSGVIVSTNCSDKAKTYEQVRTENMGAWYAFCMSLYDDVNFRLTYQSLGLFLANVYSFVEYACAKRGEARSVHTVKKVLGPYFKEIIGQLFQFRLLFTTEPFNRKENWNIMSSILECDTFYDLLQLYFNNSFIELNELRQIKYLVAIEMDKEGL